MPKTVPDKDVGHKYQPPSVIVPSGTQIGFMVTSALLPTVTTTSNSYEGISSLLINRVDFMEVA
jgi:hypothetical protein